MHQTNKRKIFNDPVYGFITLLHDFALDIIDHRYFQRLRRIKQLGLTSTVYPGALHTRFHHALGAMHLTNRAVDALRKKGQNISQEEGRGVAMAILLHDIGHGPYSHALEHTIVEGVRHEDLSLLFMEELNHEFKGQLDMAIAIFKDTYPKPFLHQLVSSQLDMDRLDYLKRDSFYTGVHEGEVGSDRIIDMLNVHNGKLAIEEKAVYSIENFIMARRYMYWQVYLHKTVVAAEHMLVKILERAKLLASQGEELYASPHFTSFLYGEYTGADLRTGGPALAAFALLDDYDILGAIKIWRNHPDKVLGLLCGMLLDRKLFKINVGHKLVNESDLVPILQKIADHYLLSEEEARWLVIKGKLTNNAYDLDNDHIHLLLKNGEVKELALASDHYSLSALAKPVEKYFVCHARI